MSAYEAYGQAGVALVIVLVVLLAPVVAWCVVGVTRWAVDRIHAWVLDSIVMPSTYVEPPSRLDTLDWIREWEASRTPEAARERVAARLAGERS